MFQVISERKINQPGNKVWSALDDFSAVYKFNPMVKESTTINETSSTGKGAERECTFTDGSKIKERIINYADKNYEVEIYDTGKFPLKTAVAHLKVEEINSESSNVSFEMNFVPKFGPVGWVMGNMMMKSQFQKMLDSVLHGLEKHIETGEIITKETKLIN